MSLAKKKSKRQARSQPRRSPLVQVEQTIERAERLIENDEAMEAIDLLEPLLARYPRMANLHQMYGYACARQGDLWGALDGYERARQLSRDPALWLPLAWLYLDLEMNSHALLAFRRALRYPLGTSVLEEVPAIVAPLERQVGELATDLGLSVSQVEKGLLYLESGGRSLQANDFQASITANRQAMRLLGNWPPPRNNLSQALFLEGKPQEAIGMARQVLVHDPDNVQALANSIRFLAWTGEEAQARELWSRLKSLPPASIEEHIKMAEAAAVLEQDGSVYELLEPLDTPPDADFLSTRLGRRAQHFLAIAEANLGRRSAQRRLRSLKPTSPAMQKLLADVKAGRPGTGWMDRFPYFPIHEIVPWPRMEEFIELLGEEDHLPEARFRSRVDHFVQRFPQIVLVVQRILWEDQQAEVGIHMLTAIATPTAYAALRRFGLSQAGDDGPRQQALLALMQAGQILPEDTLRFWSRGAWREIQLRQYEIGEDSVPRYGPQIQQLLTEGAQSLELGKFKRAEQSFRRVLELDPTVKEAYHNLGVLYGRQGDDARAKEMCEAALEIDPLYVHARCNLALYLLAEEDLDGAREILRPLSDLTRFHPQDMAFYSYAQARLAMEEEEYEVAKSSLEMALEVWPDYEPAQELLSRLELITRLGTRFDAFFEQQRKREQAKRASLQVALTVPDPSLRDALSLYTKEVLTGMGYVILPWGGWSSLRKAELLEELLAALVLRDNLERITDQLTSGEREALGWVLSRGGHLPWPEFDARCGNDLEESRYWQWHKPKTIMGRLRHRGLLVETTVEGELLVAVPLELRPLLTGLLGR